MRIRTLDVILSVRLTCLVVVYHGDDVQQVVLAQLLQPVGQLLHVNGLVAPGLLLRGVLAADTVGVGGAGVLQEGEELGLGVAKSLSSLSAGVCPSYEREAAGSTVVSKTYDLVLGLVALRLEVEVVA